MPDIIPLNNLFAVRVAIHIGAFYDVFTGIDLPIIEKTTVFAA
jgi:hypothetical protein